MALSEKIPKPQNPKTSKSLPSASMTSTSRCGTPPKELAILKIEDMLKNFKQELSILNEEQKIAVIKSVLSFSENYHMVLRTPGSGSGSGSISEKTTSIVVLIKILDQFFFEQD